MFDMLGGSANQEQSTEEGDAEDPPLLEGTYGLI